jgi:amidase
MKEYAQYDATGLAELVRKKEVSALELVNAAIARIEAVDGRLNSVVMRFFEEARVVAGTGPLPDGPFHGVPFLIKDVIAAVAGVPLTEGSRLAKNRVPKHDSELVHRFRKAGLVFVGKTNVPELGILPTTESLLWGKCHNPWDLTRSPGGSSGGAAAAVAAGIVPAAHASDGGGSIRIPASVCGLFGLKPTRGRVTQGPHFGEIMHGLVAEHALTRSVRDSARLLDAVQGPLVGDPYIIAPPARPFVEELNEPPGRLRIGFTAKSPTGVPVHPDCVAAVEDAARLCEELGHDVFEKSPAVDEHAMVPAFIAMWTACNAAMVDGLARECKQTPSLENLEPLTFAFWQMSKNLTAVQHVQALHLLHSIARKVGEFFTTVDVWLTPTLAEPPLPLGTLDSTPENPLAGFMRAAGFTPFTPVCNVTGQPAMSVPLRWNEGGLPIGSHFISRVGDEATLFRLAAQLERARPWAHRRPDLGAV